LQRQKIESIAVCAPAGALEGKLVNCVKNFCIIFNSGGVQETYQAARGDSGASRSNDTEDYRDGFTIKTVYDRKGQAEKER
jgi:hypothetical protein